ncbi:DUF4349 domain-containing protein [Streptomyces sp. NBC_01396]|uniref:DUF4349 domain-containing protein n=1 Tax=Streptomyces sp. NBC_01396 TaxID=2903852 RepID=UPI00386532B3
MKNAANLSEVVSLEVELSRRETDLESVQAQLAALNDPCPRQPSTRTRCSEACATAGRRSPARSRCSAWCCRSRCRPQRRGGRC